MVEQNLTRPKDDLLESPQSSVPDCSRLGRPDDCEYGSLFIGFATICIDCLHVLYLNAGSLKALVPLASDDKSVYETLVRDHSN